MQLFPLKNDFVFKSLFVQAPDLLASLVSSVLNPNGEHKIHKIEINNPELPKDFKDDKKSYLNIKAKDEDGRIFQVEVQLAHQSSFIKRCLFSLAGLIREQLKPGDPYSKIRAVYQINILDSDLIQLENLPLGLNLGKSDKIGKLRSRLFMRFIFWSPADARK